MDIHTILVISHIVGTILGVGGATIAEVNIVTALRNDGKISQDERAHMHANYAVIRVGTFLVVVSGALLVWWHFSQGNDWVFTSSKVWFKDFLLLSIVLNALFITKRLIPLWLGSAVSFTSWWLATILGMWRNQPFSFFELFIGYVVLVLVVAGILESIRYFSRSQRHRNKSK